ncbi:MAG: U32 family peptidase [Candidatus Pacebacteria bacterium]|nr:U32 family peptidase [Candidatus Paceibacterota bacterium]
MKKPEILSPIQDFTSLTTAIQAGADAVFFGVRGYNMRVTAKNFTIEDLPKITEIAHQAGVKAYLALNTIIYEEELAGMEAVLQNAFDAGVDAVICWDLAVIEKARAIGLNVHLSTQASVANSESALFYKKLGITRVVLARECSLEQIMQIKEKADVEIETFIHGAMCVSVSGRCFLSQFSTCHSANRGDCRQPCRRSYLIKDVENEFEYEIGPNYVLSPKDLCTLPFIEQLVFSGIDCFKIEGRNKSPEYVHDVTSVYREAVDFVWANKDRRENEDFKKELIVLKEKLIPKLERVFNRGFSSGFYLGKPLNEWSGVSDSVATEKKVHVGKVTNFYGKVGVAEVLIETPVTLAVGDVLLIQGPTTGSVRVTIASMEIEHTPVFTAGQGEVVAIKIDARVRFNDMVRKVELR